MAKKTNKPTTEKQSVTASTNQNAPTGAQDMILVNKPNYLQQATVVNSKAEPDPTAELTDPTDPVLQAAAISSDCGRVTLEAQIDMWAHAINQIAVNTVERGTREIGEYVLTHIYGGSAQEALSRNPKKQVSLRKLSERPDLHVSLATLINAVGAVALDLYLREQGIETSRFSMSHLVAMLPLRDDHQRCLLAEEANRCGFSVRQVSDRVKDFKSPRESPDLGRAIQKTIWDPRRLLQDLQMKRICSDEKCLMKTLSSIERRKILNEIRKSKPQMSEWTQVIGALEVTLEKIESEDDDESSEAHLRIDGTDQTSGQLIDHGDEKNSGVQEESSSP